MHSVDVLVVRAPEHNYDYLQWHEDINAAYLLAVFEQFGLSAEICDFALRARKNSVPDINALLEFDASVVVFVVDKHPTNNPYHVSEILRNYSDAIGDKRPHISVYGNTQVGPDRFLSALPIDSVVLGEELDAVSLVEAICKNRPISEASGIAYIDEGTVIRTALSERPNLDKLPRPKRYFFHNSDFSGQADQYVAAIQASRGCYAKCTFCFIRSKESVHGEYGWNGRNPVEVVDEMEELFTRYDVREFAFVDPQFFGPSRMGQEWASKLAQEIIDRRMEGITFSIYARANDIFDDTIALLKQAGLYAVFIGVESFSQEVLNKYKKGVKVQRNIDAIKTLMKHEIRLRMGFITFDKESTFDQIELSARHLSELCDFRGDLITQPVFFNNSLIPLEDTPLNHDSTNSKEGSADLGSFAPRLLEYRKKLSRGGAVDVNPDIRVEVLAEATRILAAEVTRRSTSLENLLASYAFSAPTKPEQSAVTTTRECAVNAMSWFDNLTKFTVSCLGEMIDTCRDFDGENIENKMDKIVDWICEACDRYDEKFLGQVVVARVDSRMVSVD